MPLRTLLPVLLVALPALPFPAASQAQTNPSGTAGDRPALTFSGSTTLTGQYATAPARSTQISEEFLRYQLNATLGIHGMPVNARLYLTTEPSFGRTSQQRFSLSASPAQLHVPLPVISWFRDITIGRSAPSYSRYTLHGTRVDGVSAEMTPGPVYLAFVTGRTERASSGAGFGQAGFTRTVIGGKAGGGSPDGTHLHATFLRAYDDPESMAPADRRPGLTPRDNFVTGLQGGLDLFARAVQLRGEVSGSVHTMDRESAEIDGLDDIPAAIRDLVNPNISTTVDYAWSLHARTDLSTTRLTGNLEWVGPGYRSLGNPWLRNDIFLWQARIDQNFLDRRVPVHLQARRSRDNLIQWKNGTTYTTQLVFGVGLRLPRRPSLQLRFTPYFQENAERGVDIRSFMVSLNSSHTYRIAGRQSTTSLFLTFQDNSAHMPALEYRRYAVSLNEVFMMTRAVMLRGAFTWNHARFETRNLTITTGEASATWQTGRDLSLSGGLRVSSQADYGSRFGFHISADMAAGVFGTLRIKAEQDFFRDDFEGHNDFDRSVISASLTRRF